MIFLCLCIAVAGCNVRPTGGGESSGGDVDDSRFAAEQLRLHPIFTRPANFAGDDRLDGITAVVELTDRFGDPVKASGNIIFEAYAYLPNSPDTRGNRLGEPWVGSIATLDLQERRWNKSLRAYNFELEWAAAGDGSTIVLQAQMNLLDGRRLTDQLVLENAAPKPRTTEEVATEAPPNSPTPRTSEP